MGRHKKLASLRDVRKKEGFTMRGLADAVGVSRQAISSYEHGEYPPREDVWKMLQKVLRIPKDQTVEDFWGREAHIGKDRLYEDDDKCSIKGCENAPVCLGYCRKHYQRVRYHQKQYGITPKAF